MAILGQVGDAGVHRRRRAREADRRRRRAGPRRRRAGRSRTGRARPRSGRRRRARRSPTISPWRTSNDSRGRRPPGSGRSTSRKTSPIGVSTFGKSDTLRPTMCRTRSAVVRSAVGVVMTCRPSRKTVARSHSSKTSSSRWLTNRTATPRARRFRTIVNSRSTSWAESDAVGSSRMSTRASTDSDLAISMSCWSAIDRPRTGAPTSSWTSSSSNSAFAARRVAPQSRTPSRPTGRGR